MNEKQLRELGEFIGNAIARDTLAENWPTAWAGLDPQDGDQLLAAGIDYGTPEWDVAEDAAKKAYVSLVHAAKKNGHEAER